jgi:type I restriction enzyme, S subunit
VPFCECKEQEKYILCENDILFARTGATTGKTHLVHNPEPAVFASYLIRLRSKRDVEASYLYSFFQSDSYWSQILEEKEGSAQPNVNGEKLSRLRIPDVPREMQLAIADVVQCIRRRQDGEEAELPELPPPLKEQRDVLLHIEHMAALIQEARILRKEATEETEALLASKIVALFNEGVAGQWCRGTLGDYVVDDCYGTSEKSTDDRTGVPILRMGNIQDGRLVLDNLKYLHLSAKDRSRLLLRPGDILVNRTNSAELVGKCAVFELDDDYAFASYLIRVRLDVTRAEPRLIAAYINSPIGRSYMMAEKKQMTGQANVNAGKIRALPIALPPLHEQRRILRELGSLQTQMDAIEDLQAEAAVELDALLPSLLSRAFAGEVH